MAQAPETVLKDLKAGKYAPLYFLQGDEPYYIDLIAGIIEENALAPHEKGFNQTIIYGKDADMSTIITQARRFPMMSERQVVIVREAQDIKDFGKESGQNMLEKYVQNPLPSTILVFCHKYNTLDRRKSISKVLDKYAVIVVSKKLYDNQVPDWVRKYLKEQGYSATEKAVAMLAENIGNNLERLSSEIDKMLINVKDKQQPIDDATVQTYVGISKEFNVFELQKALAVKDAFKAQKIAWYFAANPKENPIIPVIALLYSFFSKLLLVHHSKDQSDRNLAMILKVNPFFVKDYKVASRNYPLQKVIINIQHLHHADLQSKGVEAPSLREGEILKELIFRLMH